MKLVTSLCIWNARACFYVGKGKLDFKEVEWEQKVMSVGTIARGEIWRKMGKYNERCISKSIMNVWERKMSLVDILESYNDEYWDFKDSKNEGIHQIANYPASMVAPMQRELLQLLVNENPNYHTMLDPFHGSGVTLVEGQELGLEVCGIDINPYAHIISLAKLEKYNPHIIEQSNIAVINRINDLKLNKGWKEHRFKNIDKWFRKDIIDELSMIREAIRKEPSMTIRHYYWLCFGEIVKKYSNTRTSTFKLHVKEKEKIARMQNNVIKDFSKKIEDTYKLIGYPSLGNFELFCGNSINIMRKMPQESFDIICTSPPYGDNSTTVTYGQFSMLQLLWIDESDFDYDISCIENYSRLDSLSLGGTLSRNKIKYCSSILSSYITKLAIHKRKKIIQFYADYESAFREMVRLLKVGGRMVLTVGNRKVDGQEFLFSEINKDIALHYGMSIEYTFTRNIMNKRMPQRASKLSNGKSVETMSKEIILLLKKER